MIEKTFLRMYLASFVLGLLLCSSCDNQPMIIEEEMEEMTETMDTMDTTAIMIDTIKFLALGDSYTIGQGVEETKRWPVQLGEQLQENDFEVQVVDIIARTGWTTSNLINSIDDTEPEDYNLVSLLIGVNNQFQKLSFDIFESEFDSLVNISIDIAGSKERVFVVSIPDYGVTPFGEANREKIAEELDMYNNYISATCDLFEIPFIDITGISRDLGDSEGALAQDNLHPSGSQYEAWTNEILPVVIQILNE